MESHKKQQSSVRTKYTTGNVTYEKEKETMDSYRTKSTLGTSLVLRLLLAKVARS